MNSLNLNLYNFLIVLGIVHGVIFSFILFFSPKLKSKTNIFLALTILALCFSNLQYWLLDIGLSPGYENNNLIFIPFEFLMVPMFFLFVKSYLKNNFKKHHIYLLLIPFFSTIFYQILTDLARVNSKVIEFLNLVIEYGSLLFSIIIIFSVFKNILDYEKKVANDSFNEIPKTVAWLKRILVFGFILCILWLLSLTIFESYFPNGYYQYYPLWIGISLLIYWIAYTSIFENSIYEERGEIRNRIIKGEVTINQDTSQIQKKTLEIDELSENINPSKFSEINNLILKRRLYLKPKLSLKMISKQINLSEGYLSQIINSNTDNNFNEYINNMRVENAKKLLLDDEYFKYTITAIGLESGFNTKTSFYNAFKKITGHTPNNYKKLVQNH
jgi:AraC-like DNA-binding protein